MSPPTAVDSHGFAPGGGTLPLEAPTYVRRAADAALFSHLKAGQLCYVLTARQLGKSSLMVRTAARLRDAGVAVAIVDLSAIGTDVRPSQWFLGIIDKIVRALELQVDPDRWWAERGNLAPAQCFGDFLGDVLLAQIRGPVVIFFDEIDTTLPLPFSDDFFTAIRAAFNQRATEPDFQRLTFALIGVAAPADLIKAPERTPFNVGQPITLGYLELADAAPLIEALDRIAPGQGRPLLERVFSWTAGHPYMTQRICAELARIPGGPTLDAVDQIVTQQFLAPTAPESSLRTIENQVRAIQPEATRRQLLDLYERIFRGEMIPEDRRSPLQTRLLLIGLVRPEPNQHRLIVANQIYERAFPLAWARGLRPRGRRTAIIVGAILVNLLAISGALGFVWSQEQQTIASLRQQFAANDDDAVRVERLASLCTNNRWFSNRDAMTAANDLFYGQPHQRQLAQAKLHRSLSEPRRAAFATCICPQVGARASADYADRKDLMHECPVPHLRGQP